PFLVRWPVVVKPGGQSRALISGEDLAPTLLEAAGLEPLPRMTGKRFLPLLKGEEITPPKYVFIERGSNGSAPDRLDATNASYDLARAVRSDRYKFIYNCTPWIPYGPVDSAGGAAWKQIKAAHEQNKLAPAIASTYFTSPRPVYEL